MEGLPDTLNYALGRDWEADQKNGWKDKTWEIIKGKNWDALIQLMDNTVKMFNLITDANDLLAKATTNDSVKESATTVSICDKLDDIKSAVDRLSANKEAADSEESLANLDSLSDGSNPLSSCCKLWSAVDIGSDKDEPAFGAIAPEEEKARPIDKRQNVIVFLPTVLDYTQDEEIEGMLTYLGCEKDSILTTEMVRDRDDDYNGKSVLRVQMDTVKQASIALANAYKLKNYPLPGVYIAKDMTYHQRVKMRELVKTLRWRIDHQPKYRWKIVDWEVVNVGYFKQVQESESKPDTMNRISGSFGSLDKSEVN